MAVYDVRIAANDANLRVKAIETKRGGKSGV